MREMERGSESEGWAFGMFALFAGLIPITLPGARICLVVSLALLVAHRVRARRPPRVPAVTWLALAFIVVAVVSAVHGVNPAIGVPRLRKLMWFAAIPIGFMLVTSPARLRTVLAAFAAGGGVLSLSRCVLEPLAAWRAVRAGQFDRFLDAWIDRGSMTDGQLLMLAVVVSLGFVLLARRDRRPATGWWLLLALQCLALVVNFKRGSWICAAGVAVCLVACKSNWRYLLVLVGLVALVLVLPWTRARLSTLRSEFHADGGGRMTMWIKIAPALVRQHPWLGVGYRSLTNEMMREIAPEVEPNRDHLHSNFVQVLVATGWIGFALYAAWMVRALRDAGGFARRAARGPGGEDLFAAVLFFMLVGLLLNGLVEYNFADGELVLCYGLIMGCAAAGLARMEEPGLHMAREELAITARLG